MRKLLLTTVLASACGLASFAAFAQQKAAAPAPAPAAAPADDGEVDAPTPVPLMVGGLNLASNPQLEVEAIDIVVGAAKVTQTYRIKNTGAAEVRAAASVAMPDLSASVDGTEEYRIDTSKPENPVGLTITAGGAPVAANVITRAEALGLDRTADIRAAGLPLAPFGPESEKALKALKPEQLTKLGDMGLVSPPEPGQPEVETIADWSLAVTYAWDQVFPPGKSTDIVLAYTPSAARYPLTKESGDALDAFKDDACLPATTIKTLKTKLAAKNAAPLSLTELVVSADKPMRWRAAPSTQVSVDKPAADAIVAFCGADAKTAGQPRVSGKIEDEGGSELRVIVIGPGQ